MSEKIDRIVEDLKTLTLLEAPELVKKIEETFGVDASATASGGMVMAAAATIEEDKAVDNSECVYPKNPYSCTAPKAILTIQLVCCRSHGSVSPSA